ncbi:MAG: aspartate aminotransferase family protein [Saprospiraceae bacterium]|nr:aspartate aminotransferase family protein [Saprospiraceae bacterium]
MLNTRQLFLKHMAPTSSFPLMLEIETSEGVYLIKPDGTKMMDLISGIGVSNIGHRHPAVIQAIKEQLDKYLHTMVYGEYVLAPQVELATLLTAQLPEQLNSVYYVNSGSEATEGAMKLAKRKTGRAEIVACKKAYHGSTQGAASLMNPTDYTRAFYPLLPGIAHIEYNVFEDLSTITEKTAAVIIETVQGEWGVRKPEACYLRAVRERCTEVGALLIFDEIQAGYGRTGSLWAFEQYNVIPDILLLAKGMGGGMPIGAFISSQENMRALSEDPILGHITTFGGHPVNCAAAVACLKTILDEKLVEGVKEKETHFRTLLKHPLIKDFRSAGLLMAMELDSFDRVQKVIDFCLKNGLIVDWFLFNTESVRIAPPLIITKKEIEKACSIILKALDYANN